MPRFLIACPQFIPGEGLSAPQAFGAYPVFVLVGQGENSKSRRDGIIIEKK